MHDIKNSFEEDYDFIYEKYMRRINYFKEQIIQKTCFIRVIYNVDELKYIRANQQFINDVIKQFHKDNEIVYVVNRNIFGHEREASHPFYLVASYETGNRKELRELFDQNLKLCNFCIVNYDENHRYKNMTFDLQNEIRGLEYRNDLMDKIDRLNVEEMEIPAKIIIYGAGRIGKYFYNKVKAICQVLFFIDKSPREDAFDGVPVICYGDQLDILVDTLVVVSACYEYEEVRTNLLKRYGEINIISLEDLYEK